MNLAASVRRWALLAAALGAVGIFGGGEARASAPLVGPTVTVDETTVTGINWPDRAGVNAFLGIRYAASPAGGNRWFPPQAPGVAPSNNAQSYAAACPQLPPGNLQTALVTGPGPTFQFVPQSEDCLFLNVFVPAAATPSSHLPVFFWIHGGALVEGTGAQYDPSQMVLNNNIVVVTINYRLGALGWLAQASLEPTNNTDITLPNAFMNGTDAGDYGLMDQQFAMAWVQANISAFGGDPTRVTIGGESAGGLSTISNLTSTNIGGSLFRAAIVESGAYMLHDVPSETVYSEFLGEGFATAVSCATTNPPNFPSQFSCLQGVSLSDILTAQGTVFGANGISPDWGTLILPHEQQAALSTGEFFHVPVLIGTNANEGRLFEPEFVPFAGSPEAVIAAGGPANFDLTNPNTFCSEIPARCTYPEEIGSFLFELGLEQADTPSFVTLLSHEYPLANFPDRYLAHNAPSSDEALAQIFTDFVFACNSLNADVDMKRFTPVFAYEFNDPNAPPTVGFGTTIIPPNDVFGYPTASEHAAELQFLFNFGTPLTAAELQLATEMQTYWGNFVKGLAPNNGKSVPQWLPFAIENNVQQLIPGFSAHESFTFGTEHFCATWQPILNAEDAPPP